MTLVVLFGVYGFASAGDGVTFTQSKELFSLIEDVQKVDTRPVSRGDAGVIFQGVTISCYTYGTCSLCDILVVFVNIANLILQLFAILGVIFLVYGTGFLMLSQGNEQRLTQGKAIMKASIVGSIIVLLAWQAMAFIVLLLGNASFGIFSGVKEEKAPNPAFNPITNWFAIAQRCQDGISDPSGAGFRPLGQQTLNFPQTPAEANTIQNVRLSGNQWVTKLQLPEGISTEELELLSTVAKISDGPINSDQREALFAAFQILEEYRSRALVSVDHYTILTDTSGKLLSRPTTLDELITLKKISDRDLPPPEGAPGPPGADVTPPSGDLLDDIEVVVPPAPPPR